MKFLSIDCSTNTTYLFIKIENRSFSKILQSDKYNNDLLMKQILNFFNENNLSLDDISEILVNQGPGNFSGLRSSLSIAKGISISKKIKLYGYDTFLLGTARFFNNKNSIFTFIKYREKYFLKNFSKDLKNNSNVKEITKEEIFKKYDTNFKVLIKSEGGSLDKEILKLENIRFITLNYNDLEFLKVNDLLEKSLIRPIYLS